MRQIALILPFIFSLSVLANWEDLTEEEKNPCYSLRKTDYDSTIRKFIPEGESYNYCEEPILELELEEVCTTLCDPEFYKTATLEDVKRLVEEEGHKMNAFSKINGTPYITARNSLMWNPYISDEENHRRKTVGGDIIDYLKPEGVTFRLLNIDLKEDVDEVKKDIKEGKAVTFYDLSNLAEQHEKRGHFENAVYWRLQAIHHGACTRTMLSYLVRGGNMGGHITENIKFLYESEGKSPEYNEIHRPLYYAFLKLAEHYLKVYPVYSDISKRDPTSARGEAGVYTRLSRISGELGEVVFRMDDQNQYEKGKRLFEYYKNIIDTHIKNDLPCNH